MKASYLKQALKSLKDNPYSAFISILGDSFIYRDDNIVVGCNKGKDDEPVS